MEERRTSPRHPLRQALACWLVFPASPRSMPAVVVDVSREGVGLYLPRPPQAPTTALLEFLDAPTALRQRLPLRVAYVRAADDGGHVLGGAFNDPLAPPDLQSLLGRL